MNKEKNLIKIINKVRYFNLIQITKKKTTKKTAPKSKSKATKAVTKEKTKVGKTSKSKSLKTHTMTFGGKEVKVQMYSKFDFSGYDKEQVIEWYKLQLMGRKLDDKAALYLKMAKGWSYHAPFAGHDGIQNGQHSQLAQCRLKQIAASYDKCDLLSCVIQNNG